MKTTIRTTASLAAAAAALLATASAAAQDRQGREGRDGPFADGVLTRAEALSMATERFDKVDANGDGFLSETEAEAAKDRAEARRAERMAEREGRGERGERGRRGGRGGEDGDRIARAFERQDANDDGFISREEAREAALARFDEADADGDGEVTREEMRGGKRGPRGGRR